MEYGRTCWVRGYHVYQEIWEAAVGEVLACEREPRNATDRYAVAVKKDGTIIGHLPRKVSRVCSLFLRREEPSRVKQPAALRRTTTCENVLTVIIIR